MASLGGPGPSISSTTCKKCGANTDVGAYDGPHPTDPNDRDQTICPRCHEKVCIICGKAKKQNQPTSDPGHYHCPSLAGGCERRSMLDENGDSQRCAAWADQECGICHKFFCMLCIGPTTLLCVEDDCIRCRLCTIFFVQGARHAVHHNNPKKDPHDPEKSPPRRMTAKEAKTKRLGATSKSKASKIASGGKQHIHGRGEHAWEVVKAEMALGKYSPVVQERGIWVTTGLSESTRETHHLLLHR